MGLVKNIKGILLLKQVADAYETEHGQPKPFYLSRRFVGVIITAGVAGVALYTGIQLDIDAKNLANNIEKAGLALTAIYGVVMAIIGQVKRKKDDGKTEAK